MDAAPEIQRASRFFGTWALDVTRSKYQYGELPRSAKMRIEPRGDGLWIRIDVIGSRGTPITIDGVWAFGETERQSTVLVDERTLVHALKQDGQPRSTVRRELSEDGLELTMRQEGQENGEPWVNVSVFVRSAEQGS